MNMDPLTRLLSRHALAAGVFHSGKLCGVFDFAAEQGQGHVHLVRRGPVQILDARGLPVEIDEPSLVFLPRPERHRLITDEFRGADVVCASIRFGSGMHNPITGSLPSLIVVPLAQLPGARPLLELLYEEAFSDHLGRQASLDRLCELLLLRLLRYCLERGLARGGALAGLSDPRLAKALVAIHDRPSEAWDLDALAALAGMSRARFAVRFRHVTGETPAGYLAAWRIGVAQNLLRAGRPLKHVSIEVGYGSPAALARAFVRTVGATPTGWLHSVDGSGTAASNRVDAATTP